jgi:membrane protease YdiL (CAAX protease family)
VSGHGWPRSTQEARRRDLRAPSLAKPALTWALIAGALGITGTIATAFVTARLAHLPREAFAAPIDFSKYGALTVICAIASISATAGVVEEAGFRGFLISPIQRRHGWTIAILISGIIFFLDHHLSHAYATFVFLPFFLAISVVHGLLVKYSGSIRPSVLLHALADFIVIPVSYGLVGSFSVESVSATGIDRQFVIWIAVMAVCFSLFVPALRVLRARSETTRCKKRQPHPPFNSADCDLAPKRVREANEFVSDLFNSLGDFFVIDLFAVESVRRAKREPWNDDAPKIKHETVGIRHH